jgi:hypothetical protein
LGQALTELFQETMTALQNGLDEATPMNYRSGFNGREPGAGMCDVRT